MESTRRGAALTIDSPRIIEIQKKILFSTFLPRTNLVRCSMTMGNCIIWARKPYPLSFFVMQPMTSSWPMALMRNVIKVATGREKRGREAP